MSAAGLPMTVRTVYVISPEKILKLALTYPASTGRNFDEVRAENTKRCMSNSLNFIEVCMVAGE